MLKKYDSYYETNLQWLGKIPSHWELKKIGQVFNERKEKVSDKDFAPLSVTKNGIVPQLDNAAKSNAGDDRKKVLKGDFVINSRSDRKGSSGVSSLDGSVSLISIILEPKNFYGKYIHNLLRSYEFTEEFYRNGQGIVDDLWSTKYSLMKSIYIPIPPKEEQEAIADFLDKKCEGVDKYILKQKELIELLKEKKNSLINKAVTKGLDSKVEYKDSGIEWLGEIPKHWEFKKLKYLGKAIIGLTYSPSNLVNEDEGILVLRSSNIKNGKIELIDNVFVKMNIPEKLLTRKNDILICSRNGSRKLIGKNALINDSSIGLSFGAFTTIFRSKLNNYLYLIFNSSLFKFQSASFLTSTINQLTTGNLNSFKIPIPPKEEQKEIVEYIEKESSKIDKAISHIEDEIKLLQEYKQSLISSAVTGKIKVV